MILAEDRNVSLASLPSADWVDVVVEHVAVDSDVAAGKPAVDKAADIVADRVADMVLGYSGNLMIRHRSIYRCHISSSSHYGVGLTFWLLWETGIRFLHPI